MSQRYEKKVPRWFRTVSVEVAPIDDSEAIIDAQIRPVLTAGATEEGTWANAEVRSRRGSAYIEIGGVDEGSVYDLRFRWSAGAALLPAHGPRN